MKNRVYLVFSSILIIASLVLIFVGAAISYKLLIASILLLFIGIILLMHWSTTSYRWKCEECKETFEITLLQNVFGINGGVNYKSLYCPKCNKKTMCKGITINK